MRALAIADSAAMRKILSARKTLPVVRAATEAGKSRVRDALKAGAPNYIINPFEPSAIVYGLEQTGA